MESLRRKRLIQSQILFDLVYETSAQLLAAARASAVASARYGGVDAAVAFIERRLGG